MSFAESTAVLRLTDVAIEDSGEYMCEAQNEAGSDHCTGIVIVKGWFSLHPHVTKYWAHSTDPCPLTQAIVFYYRVTLLYQGI
jgi:hypothetical protein